MTFSIALALLISCLGLNIEILTSYNTDSSLKALLVSRLIAINHEVFEQEVLIQNSLIEPTSKIDIVVDLTSLSFFHSEIARYSDTYKLVTLQINPVDFRPEKWIFCVHSHLDDHLQGLTEIVRYLNWEKVVTWTGLDMFSRQLGEKLLEEQEVLEKFLQASDNQQGNFDLLLGKQMKPSGYKQFIVVGNGKFVEKVLKSSQNLRVYSSSGWVIASPGIYVESDATTIILVESGLETVVSELDYDVSAILSVIFMINTYKTRYFSSNPQGLQEFLEKSTKNHYKSPDFSIVNSVNSEKTTIGNIHNGVLSVTSPITFPSINPDNSFPKIPVSMSFNNPVGLPSATIVPYLQTGAIFAANFVKATGSALANHDLEIFYASCAAEFFIPELAYYCWMQNSSNLGYLYLTSPVYDVAIGEMNVFSSLGIAIPQIGGQLTESDLSDEGVYPMFTRVASTVDDYAFFAAIINSYNFEQLVILYTNTTSSIAIYQGLLNIPQMVLVNDLEKRMLPAGYNKEMFEEYKSYFQEIFDKGVRPILLIGDSTEIFNMAEGLYDIKLRRGDVIVFVTLLLAGNINALVPGEFKDKVEEIMFGSASTSGVEWVGDYGQVIKTEIQQAFGLPVSYRCFSFDAMMLGIHAIDFLMLQGKVYEDPLELNQGIRVQRFTGCSGLVSIETGSNNRNSYLLGLYNLITDNVTGLYIDQLAATYDKQSIIPFTFLTSIVWPLNNTELPSYSRFAGLTCPFEDRAIQDNSKGQLLFYFIIGIVIAFSIFTTFFIWKKWWNKQITMMEVQVAVKFGDYVVMMVIVIDMIQVLAMGPDLYPIISGTNKVMDLVSVSTSNLMNFQFEVYWRGVYVVLVVVACWGFLMIIIFFRLDERINWSVLKTLSSAGVLAMPLIGDALFLPIISILLFIFDCQKGTGSSLADSYLAKDCYTYCWRGNHLIFALLSIVALLIYIPSSIFCRPLWQELEPDVNIHTNPKFSMGKGLLQVILVILNRTLKKYNQSLHGGVLMLLLLMFFVFSTRFKPYNYSRTNLWRQLTIAITCWSMLISGAYWLIIEYQYLWTFLYFIGWALLIVFGICVQGKRFPSLLYSEKPVDIAVLVKFAFGNSIKVESLGLRKMMTLRNPATKYVIRSEETKIDKGKQSWIDEKKPETLRENRSNFE